MLKQPKEGTVEPLEHTWPPGAELGFKLIQGNPTNEGTNPSAVVSEVRSDEDCPDWLRPGLTVHAINGQEV